MEVNPAKPRRGSFEVTLLRPDGSSEWGPEGGRGALVSDRGHRDLGGEAGAWRSDFVLLALFPGVELWTGIKKGPPRKLKFPEPQEVVKELKKYLS